MCGIAGIFHLQTAKPVDPKRIRSMCDPMVHRGPDGSGVWTDAGVGLGHRRLSIIDVEGSPQPMQSSDGKRVLSFNGEIYNYQKLRLILQNAGYEFLTDGDSEVILHGWDHWGAECVKHFQGMFAFAIYDARDKSLFLARDRLGVKPLHFAQLSDGSVIFASELKGLLAHPALRRELNLFALDDYLAFGYVPDHTSIVTGVQKLAAGHYLLLKQGKPLSKPIQWWDIDFSDRVSGSEAELQEELLRLMGEAVKSRMVSDVPLGAFLSGGVDSSAVVALMSEQSKSPVKTCSIGFNEAKLDESGYADQIAHRFLTDHRTRTVAADDYALLDRLTDLYDEPFADASALPTYRVCELARENVTVALSGDGADEAMAGYRRHVFHHGEERVRSLFPTVLRRKLFGTLGEIYPKADWAPRPLRAKTTLLSLAREGHQGYAEAVGVTSPDIRQRLYSAKMLRSIDGYSSEAHMHDLMQNAPARSGLDQAQYADMKMWLPGDILTKVDRASMGVSLEAREPLLDHHLIEFAAKLPENMRVRRGQGKYLMKRSLEKYLPEDILYRPKMGFVTPIANWFRGPLADTARNISSSSILQQSGYFDADMLSKLADDHIAGKSDNSRTLWQLVILEKSLTKIFA